MRRLALTIGVALALLAGCGGPLATVPAPVATETTVEAVPSAPIPTMVSVAALGVSSTLTPLYLDAGLKLVPPPVAEPMQAGWFAQGVHPGDVGPAVIAAHVSGRPPGANASVPGLFARLAHLPVGAPITVTRVDGSVLTFTATRIETYPKAKFPTASVYGDTSTPELRLITCGGTFNADAHSYDSNVVVYAQLKEPS